MSGGDTTPRLTRGEWRKASRRLTPSQAGSRALRRLVPGPRELPAYVIVGVKRGGTSSLHEYVIEHPDVLRPSVLKGTHYFDVNHDRGWGWFTRHFPTRRQVERLTESGRRPVVGDVSPYLVFHPKGASRLAAELPAARVIIVLRDPAARAWSHFCDETERGFETRPLAAALEAEAAVLANPSPSWRETWEGRHHSYLARGLYAQQIATLFDHIDRGNVLVLQSEELFVRTDAVMQGVFEFLALPGFSGSFDKILKPTAGRSLPDDGRRFMTEYFATPNRQLADLLGRDFGWDES